MMRDIEARVLDWTVRQGLIAPGETVLVALSGGADSVCLLRVLLALRARLSIVVRAAHYDHRLRGADSAQDVVFVQALCRALDVPLILGVGDVAEAATASGRGVEETARTMRYDFLEDAACKVHADKIATAHHADDQVETVLLHMLRGAGLRGLSGIPPCRGRVVRPLLTAERREIMGYLAELGQNFVEDATNRDTKYRRNALRHQVVPLLRAQNPNLSQTVLRQSELLRQDAAYLDRLAEAAFLRLWERDDMGIVRYRLSVCGLLDLDPAISSRVVSLAVRASGGAADWVHVQRVLDIAAGSDPSAMGQMRGGVVVRRVYDRLVFESDLDEAFSFLPVVLPEEGMVRVSETGMVIAVRIGNVKILQTKQKFCFQRSRICGKITVRPRQAGDVIRLAGRNGTKTVKKCMIEEKIPARERGGWPIFADESGVIAVYGVGVAERVRPVPGEEMLIITVEEG